MSETVKAKRKRNGKRTLRRILRMIRNVILLLALLAAALFGLKAYISANAAQEADAVSYSMAKVMRGDMEQTVYGTGTTSARNQPNILAQADGTLTQLNVSVGDEVREGDIIAILTNEEIDDEITDLEFALWDLDATIADTSSGGSVLTVEAPVAGRVVKVYGAVGDDTLAVFRREGALAIISTDGRMKVELVSDQASMNMTLGEKVNVTGDGFEAQGTVTDLIRQNTQATITINDDSLPMDAPVSVRTLDGALLGEGVLAINKPMAVSAYGGTIKSVHVAPGDTVKRTEVLFRMEDSPLTLRIEELRLQRETAAEDLADAKQRRENLIVLAPCDGVIASLDVAEGDTITSGQLMGSILHGEEMNLTIAVDELDVVSVVPGQPVVITVDALGDLQMSGEVYKIAPVGTNSGGVTTYDVELTFDSVGTGVRSGMNATGEIRIAQSTDTLYVPVEALMTINNETYVMVMDEAGEAPEVTAAQAGSRAMGSMNGGMQGAMPQAFGDTPGGRQQRGSAQQAEETSAGGLTGLLGGFKAWLYEDVPTAQQQTGTLVKVEVGLQNDDYAEILSGVSEGDVVLYTASSDDSSGYGWNNRGGMGGMGSMGGMPRGF